MDLSETVKYLAKLHHDANLEEIILKMHPRDYEQLQSVLMFSKLISEKMNHVI